MNTHEEDMRQIAEAIQLEAADCGRFMGTPLGKSLALDVMAVTAERDALAALVAGLRAALETLTNSCTWPWPGNETSHRDPSGWAMSKAQTALSLPLPTAAERVAGWKQKAEHLDDWATKWEDFCIAPTDDDEKQREAFVDADLKLRRYARELRAARGAE